MMNRRNLLIAAPFLILPKIASAQVGPAGLVGLITPRACSRGWGNGGAATSFTNSRFDVSGSGAVNNWNSAIGGKLLTAGKWQWEVVLVSTALASQSLPGMANTTASLNNYLGSTAQGFGYQSGQAANALVNGPTATNTANVGTFANNDVFTFNFDAGGGFVYIARNGTYYNFGNPAAGTGNCFSSVTGGWYPACSVGQAGQTIRFADGVNIALTYPLISGYTVIGC